MAGSLSDKTRENTQAADPDRYLAIVRPYEATLVVQGSRFVARLAPVACGAGAEHVIEDVRRVHHDATHHCFAYRVGYGREPIERFSDAGEPAGTAGRPILEALQAKHVWDVGAVVTRWFGGVKLGTGGLRQAYREVTDMALIDLTLISRLVVSTFTLRFPHALTGAAYRVLNEFTGCVTSTDFGARVRLSVTVKRADGPAFSQRMIDASHGAIEVQHVGESVR